MTTTNNLRNPTGSRPSAASSDLPLRSPDPLLSPEAIAAVDSLVRRAGESLLRYWPGGRTSGSGDGSAGAATAGPALDVEIKADGSPVSNADYASNAILVEGLRNLFPNDGILSEELPPENGRSPNDRLWIIDPLDGTRNFVAGMDDFSVLVSLCLGPQAMYGWSYFPARSEMAFGGRGKGASIDGRAVTVSHAEQIRPQAVYVRNVELSRPELAAERGMDSGCALVALARGTFDGVCIRLLTHREWDLAAATVLIEEAGGRVTDEVGNSIAYNVGRMPCRYFLASNGLVHDELRALIPPEER